MSKIGTVMLVDDNDTDNFISKRIIEITEFSDNVIVRIRVRVHWTISLRIKKT